MGAEHLRQSIKGDLRETITNLEDSLDSARSALKTFEALPSASHNTARAEIPPGAVIECSNRECDWRNSKFGVCTHCNGKCKSHYILDPA